MTPDGRLSVAVVGCGHWGPNHIRAFTSLPGVVANWAVDPSPERRRSIELQDDRIRVASTLDQALADPGLDAVVIASPAATHFALAKAALLAGKHVLCEKPLTLNSREAGELIETAAKSRVVLMTGHVFLFNAGIQKLAELVHKGDLGAIHYASASRTNLGPVRADTNAAADLAVHDISIFNFLFACPPLSVSACGRSYLRPGIEDITFLTLTYPGGIVAGITASWLSPRKVREITVVGARKMAVWNDLASGPVSVFDQGSTEEPWYENYGEFQLRNREGGVTVPRIDWEEPLRRQARFFVESIGRGAATLCSGQDGLDVVRTLEAVMQSMRAQGAPIAIKS